MKKNYSLGEGFYYFTIKNAGPNGIMIKRKTKEEAAYAYLSYVKVGKDCEWHGRWEGKKFSEGTAPKG